MHSSALDESCPHCGMMGDPAPAFYISSGFIQFAEDCCFFCRWPYSLRPVKTEAWKFATEIGIIAMEMMPRT